MLVTCSGASFNAALLFEWERKYRKEQNIFISNSVMSRVLYKLNIKLRVLRNCTPRKIFLRVFINEIANPDRPFENIVENYGNLLSLREIYESNIAMNCLAFTVKK